MYIAAADSSAAILSADFQPLTLIASAAVLVREPFREADKTRTRDIFLPVESRQEIAHEIDLCRELLAECRADAIHVDMSLGGIDLSTTTFEEVEKAVPSRIRARLRDPLKIVLERAREIRKAYGIPVLAIGKNSIAVRIAELAAGAYAVSRIIERVEEEGRAYTVGLPHACELKLFEGGVCLTSLLPAEGGVRGMACCPSEKLRRVSMAQINNPIARGFKAVTIKPA